MFPSPAHSLRAGALALAVFLLCLVAPRAGAAVPPAGNDTCASAVVVPGAGPFPYLTPPVDVVNMTTNGDPPLPPDLTAGATRGVWFRFTPAASTNYTFSLGADTLTDLGDGANDTALAIYSSASGCAGSLALVACNEDSAAYNSAYSLAAGLSTNLSAGTDYFILVWVGSITSAGDPTGPLELQLRVSVPSVPPTDLCANAEVVPSTGPFPHFTSIVDNTMATAAGDVMTGCDAGQRSVWFKFAPSDTGTYVISSRDSATTLGVGTLAIYLSGGGDCSSLTPLSCSTFDSAGRGVITRLLNTGSTYYLALWDNEPDYFVGETSAQLKVTRAGPPIVTTLAATSITSTGATLRGLVNPNGGLSARTRRWFEWGVTTNYGFTSPTSTVYVGSVAVTTNVSVSFTTNFTAGLTYYFRAVATNEYGTNFGAPQIIAPSASPMLPSPTLLGGGAVRLDFTGLAGYVHIAQTSTNLVNWTDLGQATEMATGIFQFQTPPNSAPHRFYKLRLP